MFLFTNLRAFYRGETGREVAKGIKNNKLYKRGFRNMFDELFSPIAISFESKEIQKILFKSNKE